MKLISENVSLPKEVLYNGTTLTTDALEQTVMSDTEHETSRIFLEHLFKMDPDKRIMPT